LRNRISDKRLGKSQRGTEKKEIAQREGGLTSKRQGRWFGGLQYLVTGEE